MPAEDVAREQLRLAARDLAAETIPCERRLKGEMRAAIFSLYDALNRPLTRTAASLKVRGLPLPWQPSNRGRWGS